MIAVADTTPLHYLILIEQTTVLPSLFGQILVAPAVLDELSHLAAPEAVRQWAAQPPSWITCHAVHDDLPTLRTTLGRGERETIALAQTLGAEAVLMDDRDARREAQRRGLRVVGTLRVLASASDDGLLDLSDALARLQHTSFRADAALLRAILAASPRER